MASVGVPIADARCCGAESFVTIAWARPINSADESSDSVPIPSMTHPGGSASLICSAIAKSAFEPISAIRKSSDNLFASSA
jgi:hypothetical protein